MIGLARSSLQYRPVPRDDDALRLALIRLAKQYGRYGYRKVTELLHIEGWQVNHKKVERLWREEGLQLPRRHKKRKRLYHQDSSIIRMRPTHPNHVWAIDFVHDKLSNGRSYKMLTVLDEFTRQALAVTVRTKMGAEDVLEALYTMAISNIFGSNLIMLVLVFPADMLFRSGPILQDASRTVSLALAFGIVVTAIFLTGMIIRRKPKVGAVGLDSVLVLIAFVGSLFAYYAVR